jgi:superfamily II DNA or RNA helicase
MNAAVEHSSYESFLAQKAPRIQEVGFEAGELNPRLFAWQGQLVRWALRLGRAALFADCGLGKTPMQSEWANQVARHTGGEVLILAPLAVASQTIAEGKKFGIDIAYAKSAGEISGPLTVTNYERLDGFDPKRFAGVVLDESSILKAFSGKTKVALVEAFAETQFKLACTATPSPNDVMELGNHCEFLGVMSSHEMLARWFINDTMAAGKYRLKGHAEADFWRWVVSWASCLSGPQDLLDGNGQPYDGSGYELPGLEVVEHVVEGPAPEADSGELVHVPVLTATTLHKEMRRTVEERADRAAELVAKEKKEPWVIWCNTDYEADALVERLPKAIEVRGSHKAEVKEERLRAFSAGKERVLITKPSIAGFGLNWQHCARMAFVGLSYSYEAFYQALRRSYRFGQKRPVVAHVICARTEAGVRSTVARKQEEHRRLQRRMVQVQSEVRQEEAGAALRAQLGAPMVDVARGEGWELFQGDCVEVLRDIPSNSVDLEIFSPPFSSLYTYSASLRDMGNCADDAQFFRQFGFLVPELLRVTKPGRLAVIHTKDLPRYRSSTGASGLKDFTGDVLRAMEAVVAPDGSRWVYHSKVTIWKCPVTEMQRTKSHGLLYKTLKADASFSRQGCPDYLTVFRKWTPEVLSADPVTHSPEDLPLETWQRYASPVWEDIDQTDVLNADVARASQDEKHICPLQLDVIERCVHLWSNPGDLVLSPFAGIGSEGFVALKKGRRFVGVELKPEYWKWAQRNLANATAQGELQLFGGAK